MPTLEDLSALKNENIRKALRGFIAVAKMGVIPPTAITTSPNSHIKSISSLSDQGHINNILEIFISSR